MDYQMLFVHTDAFTDGNFHCTRYRHEGKIVLPGASRYPLLFLLGGRLEMRFASRFLEVEPDRMVVIDRNRLHGCRCTDHTVILQYAPPERLAGYFRQNSMAFRTPVSNTVPILPTLRKWIDSLLEPYVQGGIQTKERSDMHRMALISELADYPQELLGELYVPFFAYARELRAVQNTVVKQ